MAMKRFLPLLLIGIIGCAAPPPPKPAPVLSPTLDRCADHLQEICGIILEYYVNTHQLPATLEQLQAIGAQQNEPPDLFICPLSRLRYIYNTDGAVLPALNPPAHLVMYDAEPVHNGHRWGIAISNPVGGRPLICRVVIVPNGIALTPPTTQPGN
jgi:hypothetical protein